VSKLHIVLFLGGIGGSPVADMVADCHRAIALDTIERARLAGIFGEVILVTNGGGFDPSVVVEKSGNPFHFGRRLKEIIEKYGIETPFYIGGGSIPLLSSDGLRALGEQLSSSKDTVITNNPFSADLVAFTPGKAIGTIELPSTDNPLAQLLVRQANLYEVALPHTACYQFDVDTPTDLFILTLHPGIGHNTRAYLEGLDLDTSRLERAMRLFADGDAQVLVAGRVGSYVWSQLERETSCRVRMLSEERSLRADERDRRGEVCTILGFYLEQVGAKRFFETLAQLGDAAFIDTRVLFTHFGLSLTLSDRFYSDLGQYEKIDNPFAREFTEQALEAPIPVILGGHSLVSGGLLALIEVARMEQQQGY
jgi:hypothetical protein